MNRRPLSGIESAISAAINGSQHLGQLLDAGLAIVDPQRARMRRFHREMLAAAGGYEAAAPSRKRRFSLNTQAGDALARSSAVALRNQARYLERNHDVARGVIEKLVDFSIGPYGITVEPQPKRLNGQIHDAFAELLERAYARYSEWPEVTWTHDRASMERLVGRTWYRDGEGLGQMICGPRTDLSYGSEVPFAVEMFEPDFLPHDLDNVQSNVRQGIERNKWGRPIAYHLYYSHPGDDRSARGTATHRVMAERMLHVRHLDRMHQLRGVTALAPVLTRLQDLFEYEDSERMAAKMAASLVLKLTHGDPSAWDPLQHKFDPNRIPVYQMDGGMIVANTQPGEDAEFFDTKRPNSGAEPWIAGEHRAIAAGTGLSYSAVSRNYNGTYSAQRQELVENWPHYHALTGIFVAQWERPSYQEFCRWFAFTNRDALPPDLDLRTLADAQYFGPAMPVIDPEKEVNSQLLLVQACFKSSSQVMRQIGNRPRDTYRQLEAEKRDRKARGLSSSVDAPPVPAAAVSPAKPAVAPAATARRSPATAAAPRRKSAARKPRKVTA